MLPVPNTGTRLSAEEKRGKVEEKVHSISQGSGVTRAPTHPGEAVGTRKKGLPAARRHLEATARKEAAE